MNSQVTAVEAGVAYQPDLQWVSALPQGSGWAGAPEIEPHPTAVASHRVYAFTKRAVDIGAALVLSVALSPIMLLVMLALKREAGVVLVRHKRIGKNGHEFEILKFRTLVPDPSAALREFMIRDPQRYRAWLQDQSLECDPRLTQLGKFLRKANLDQLPKLWNVLKGDMSMVGPRPITREELRKYGGAARYYLAHRPGLTGFWQTAEGNSRDYRRRIATAKLYTLSASLWVDLAVLLSATARLVIRPQLSGDMPSADECPKA